jgi:hypothetical protein
MEIITSMMFTTYGLISEIDDGYIVFSHDQTLEDSTISLLNMSETCTVKHLYVNNNVVYLTTSENKIYQYKIVSNGYLSYENILDVPELSTTTTIDPMYRLYQGDVTVNITENCTKHIFSVNSDINVLMKSTWQFYQSYHDAVSIYDVRDLFEDPITLEILSIGDTNQFLKFTGQIVEYSIRLKLSKYLIGPKIFLFKITFSDSCGFLYNAMQAKITDVNGIEQNVYYKEYTLSEPTELNEKLALTGYGTVNIETQPYSFDSWASLENYIVEKY